MSAILTESLGHKTLFNTEVLFKSNEAHINRHNLKMEKLGETEINFVCLFISSDKKKKLKKGVLHITEYSFNLNRQNKVVSLHFSRIGILL